MMDFEKTARELIRDYGFDHAFLEGAIRAALLQVYWSTLEQAAGVAEKESERVLSRQSGKTDDFSSTVDLNIRLCAMLLPDIAAAIRSLSDTPKEQTGK